MKYIKPLSLLLFALLLSSYTQQAQAGGGPTYGQVLGGSTNIPSTGTGSTSNATGSTANGSSTNTGASTGSTAATGTSNSGTLNNGSGLDITLTQFGDIGIKFNDGDLIKSPNEKKVYIMFRGLKTAAVTMQTLKRLGLDTRPIKILTFSQTETVRYGNPIILE